MVLSDEEKEDMGLGFLMSQADRNKTISREEVMKKLGRRTLFSSTDSEKTWMTSVTSGCKRE